jgi:hypothetical protein
MLFNILLLKNYIFYITNYAAYIKLIFLKENIYVNKVSILRVYLK